MEIRHALALKKPLVLLHGERAEQVLTHSDLLTDAVAESDARYGSFDFRMAHADAPSDLQQMLDSNESLVSSSVSPTRLLVDAERSLLLTVSPFAGEGTSAMEC